MMADATMPPLGRIDLPPDARIYQLERLVLFITKMLPVPTADPVAFPGGAEIAAIIEDLKSRHPDV